MEAGPPQGAEPPLPLPVGPRNLTLPDPISRRCTMRTTFLNSSLILLGVPAPGQQRD
jgi:hypothetical protein